MKGGTNEKSEVAVGSRYRIRHRRLRGLHDALRVIQYATAVNNMIPKITKKQTAQLRQMYNHANVLHNIAWEARHALHKKVDKLFRKCKTENEWNELHGQIIEIVKCQLWNCPENPKPKRPASHSGNVDILGFYEFYLLEELKKKDLTSAAK